MHLVLIAGVFPPEPEPGAIMNSELARDWSNSGHDVTVICSFPNRPRGMGYKNYGRRPWKIIKTENYRIIRVWTWFIGPKRRFINRLLENITFGISSSIALLFIGKMDFVVMDTWAFIAQFMTIITCKIKSVKIISYVQDLFPDALVAAGLISKGGTIERILMYLDNKIFASTVCTIVVSERMKEVVLGTRKDSAGKVLVIHNWLDMNTIKPFEGENKWREEVGLSKDDIVFMFAGTMGFASGADILVEVAEKLKHYPKIKIVCVGEGFLKEKIIQEKKSRDLSNLLVLGFQPRERVNEMQSSADVMLLVTSRSMGVTSVPSKLITYLAVGKPVLCAADETSDIAHLVSENDVGLVVKPGNVYSISEGIIQLASSDPEILKQKGLKAREVALRVYSKDRAMGNLKELFNNLTDGNKKITGAAADLN